MTLARRTTRGLAAATVFGCAAALTAAFTTTHGPAAAPTAAAQPPALTPAAVTAVGGSALTGAQEASLNGVSCLSARNCLAVGADFAGTPVAGTWTPLADTWNSTRWRAVHVTLPSGASGARLDAVACPAATGTYCVAVGAVIKGSAEEALAETWNGKAWAPTTPPAPPGSQLEAVSCLSPKSCVAAGVGSATGGIGGLLAESWNGRRWTPGKISAPAQGGFLDGVSCATASFCVAAGAVFTGRTGAETPLIEGWNGKRWAVMKPAKPKTSIQTGLFAVSCPSRVSCVTVGSGGDTEAGSIGYAETWNGKTWVLTSAVPWPKGTTDPWLYGVSCRAAGHCVAVGLDDWNPASNGTLTGYAAAATWNGKTWTATTVAVPGKNDASAFGGVTCRPGKRVFCAAVGYRGPQNSGVSRTLSGFWNGRRWQVILPGAGGARSGKAW
jgi:hypothetical protein